MVRHRACWCSVCSSRYTRILLKLGFVFSGGLIFVGIRRTDADVSGLFHAVSCQSSSSHGMSSSDPVTETTFAPHNDSPPPDSLPAPTQPDTADVKSAHRHPKAPHMCRPQRRICPRGVPAQWSDASLSPPLLPAWTEMLRLGIVYASRATVARDLCTVSVSSSLSP